MTTIILYTVISTLSIGLISAVVLYIASVKFKVYEDPKIDEIEEVLPATNCGGCGYPGCRPFAEAVIKADNLDDLYCTVGGNETMNEVAEIAGMIPVEHEKLIAVLRCSGSSAARSNTTDYDGVKNCSLTAAIYSGESDCQYGCLGMGECVDVCDFNALHMDAETGLPVVNADNCTACNACVEVCPKDLFELRPLGAGKKNLRIYVACMNEEKGGIAKKACEVACIGCNKCVKVCGEDAIVVENFLAYIDFNKCTNCRKCVYECPTDAILDINFPPRKEVNPNKVEKKVKKEKSPPKPKEADEIVLLDNVIPKREEEEKIVVRELINTKKPAE
jgi:RnfABCDGE-type electron transport complex B subunit